MPRLMTITDYKMVVDHIEAQPLPESVRKSMAEQFDKLLFETLTAGWPPSLHSELTSASSGVCPECGGAILHRSNCKLACWT